MLMVFTRREFNHVELEDAAQSSVNSAFQAWRINHGTHYYDNPEYAEMMASNPNLKLPDLSKPQESLPPPEVTTAIAEDSIPLEVVDKSNEEKLEDKVADQSVSQEVVLKDETKNDESDASVEEVTEEEDSMDAMKAKLAAEKKKKKAQTVPPELLNNANTYEDKLMVVRLITEQDHGRVAAVLKKMIQGGV